MSGTMDLNLDQIKSLILQFDINEKIELAEYLDKLTLKHRFEKFFTLIKDVPLSFDDITKEVETVREEQKKYQSKNNK